MEILQAILLGVVEGFTEFLPISSTGHLIVASEVMGYKDTAKIFTVVIQAGAIGAVIWNYRRDLLERTLGMFRREKKHVHFWKIWILATIPGGIAGFLLRDLVNVYAVSLTVATALIIGGIIILLIETYHKSASNRGGEANIDGIGIKQALKIGLFQMLALIPGVSRSGATIMGGLLMGLDRVTSAAFSFYLSIPIIVLASAYQLSHGTNGFDSVSGGLPAIIAGTVSAFIVALVVIKWLLRYVSKHDFKIFAYYRIVLGLIIIVALIS